MAVNLFLAKKPGRYKRALAGALLALPLMLAFGCVSQAKPPEETDRPPDTAGVSPEAAWAIEFLLEPQADVADLDQISAVLKARLTDAGYTYTLEHDGALLYVRITDRDADRDALRTLLLSEDSLPCPLRPVHEDAVG